MDHEGPLFPFPRLCIEPAPGHHVPIYVGGANEAALRRAAVRGDGWIGAGNHPDEVPALMARLQTLREEAGRAAEPFETIVGLTTPADVATLQRLEESGMTSTVNMPFSFALGKQSTLDAKKRFMEDFERRIMRPLRG